VRRRVRAGAVLAGGGAALVAAGVALTLGTGAGATTSGGGSGTASAPGPEDPGAFLTQLAAAFRGGDATFLYDRLNPAVISRFGSAACQAHVRTLTDTTASFAVVSVGSPGNYSYTTGTQSTVVPDTIAVQVVAADHGTTTAETVHLARLASGKLSWFTDCAPGA